MSSDSSNDDVDVVANLERIRAEVVALSKGRDEEVKLLAVSKTKPVSDGLRRRRRGLDL